MLMRIIALAERLPSWLRPAFYGAVALLVIVSLRMVFALPLIIKEHKGPEFALALLAATSAGAVGGFGYSLLGAPARRIPHLGPYLAGVITVGAYMLALLLAAPFISSEPLVSDRTEGIIFVGVTAFFGLLVGHFWFRR